MTFPRTAVVKGPPLKPLDRFLAQWRIAKAGRYIPKGARVLDIGCYDGALFRILGSKISGGVGIDPVLTEPFEAGPYRLTPGEFPSAAIGAETFDAITALAVLEHVPEEAFPQIREAVLRSLKPGGVLIVTVPSAFVDKILDVLVKLKVVSGMSVDEHHGFEPAQLPGLLSGEGLGVEVTRKFQLGLNNLFVLRRS